MLTAKQLIGALRAMIDHIEKNVEAEVTAVKAAVKPKAEKAVTASAVTPTVEATAQAGQTVAPAVTPTVEAAAPVVTAATNSIVPPPVTVAEAAEALKSMVNSGKLGATRDDAVALIKSFGVTTMAQIPPARLAEFAQKCRDAANGLAAPAAADPLSGLLN